MRPSIILKVDGAGIHTAPHVNLGQLAFLWPTWLLWKHIILDLLTDMTNPATLGAIHYPRLIYPIMMFPTCTIMILTLLALDRWLEVLGLFLGPPTSCTYSVFLFLRCSKLISRSRGIAIMSSNVQQAEKLTNLIIYALNVSWY